MSKRGQLTIFIIIGIIILLSATLLIFLRYSAEETITEQAPVVSAIAFDVQPVRDYIERCTETIAKQAIRKAGDQGGYVTHSFAANSLEPTESPAVRFTPQSQLAIPYWLHMSADNDCTGSCQYQSHRPALREGQNSLREQINTYVEENLPTCLSNFESLRAQGFDIRPTGAINAQTTIAATQVHVLVNYPISVTRDDTEHRIEDSLATLNVNLGQMFDVASRIVNIQQETRFLEQYTRNLIDGFSEIDSQALPPVTGFVVDFGPGEIWIKKDVQDRLKQILHAYIPLLQVHGARNYRFIESGNTPVNDPELYEILYNRGALIPLNDTPRNLNIKFSFLDWWNPYLDLNCRGQICQGQSASSTYGFLFGMQQYNFAYDLSYPVLVEIENPDALNNEGYSFKYFMEVNVRNNQPMPAQFNPLTAIDIPTGSQLCDIDKRFSGDIHLTIIDGRTGRAAQKAYPTFSCGEEACAFNAIYNGSGTIQAPLCIGGLIGADSIDAQPGYAYLDTFYNESENVTLTIEPIRYVNFAIKNYAIRKSGNAWELDTTNLVGTEPDEDTIIQLERIASEFEKPFSTFATIKGDPFSTESDLSTEIPLVPGRYNVIISSFKYAEPPITIPARTLSLDTGGFGSSKTVNIPGIEFNDTNPLPIVGTEFEWEVTKEDLDTHNTVEFRGIKFALDKTPESDRELSDLEIIGDVNQYYAAYPTLLEPEWI